MGFLRDQSIRSRLLLLTFISSSIGLSLAFLLFTVYDEHLLRVHKVEELQSAADLIGLNSQAALVFDDETEGAKILLALQSRRQIEQDCTGRTEAYWHATSVPVSAGRFALLPPSAGRPSYGLQIASNSLGQSCEAITTSVIFTFARLWLICARNIGPWPFSLFLFFLPRCY
jgi:hypothetical protein